MQLAAAKCKKNRVKLPLGMLSVACFQFQQMVMSLAGGSDMLAYL
jgi:hypothetical protein